MRYISDKLLFKINFKSFYSMGLGLSGFFSVLFAVCLTIYLTGCAGGVAKVSDEKFEVPVDLPEVCQGIDFAVNVQMRDICGVRSTRYKSYKNVLKYRMLLLPKGGTIVQKGDNVELRLPKTVPVTLPESLITKIDFSEADRLKYLKNSYEYEEFFPENSDERIKMMKIKLPLNDGSEAPFCFQIPPPKKLVSKTQGGYAGDLDEFSCKKFDKMKPKSE